LNVYSCSGNRRIVEELSGLQMPEPQAKHLLRYLRHGLEERQGHLCPDDGSGLQKLFLLRRQAVDARRQHRLHRGRNLDTRQCLRQAIGPRRADQPLRFHQGAHALLQKEGVALRLRNQTRLEWRQPSIVPQEALQPGLGTPRGERVEPELGVVGFLAPAVLILGAVVDEQEHAGSGEALYQTIEELLSLGGNPVQILDDQQERLRLALPQEQAFEGIQGTLAALRRIEGFPC
jgi:hypothetical protein